MLETYMVVGVVAAALLVYLTVALLKPEWFG
jgi:K+-transporting ATPase KdpF subunit